MLTRRISLLYVLETMMSQFRNLYLYYYQNLARQRALEFSGGASSDFTPQEDTVITGKTFGQYNLPDNLPEPSNDNEPYSRPGFKTTPRGFFADQFEARYHTFRFCCATYIILARSEQEQL